MARNMDLLSKPANVLYSESFPNMGIWFRWRLRIWLIG